MSKFYVQGNISSESDDEEKESNIASNVDKNKNNRKKFDVDDDNYDKQQKGRVIQTQSQKRNIMFNKLSAVTISAVNANDYQKAWENLQQFLRQLQKSSKLIQKQGIPRSFLRTLKHINDKLTTMSPQQKKSIKNPKSFNIMKQKLKIKIIPQYKQQLSNFKQQDKQQSSQQLSQISSSSNQSQQQTFKKYLDSDDPYIRRKYWLLRDRKQKSEQSGQQKQPKKQKDRKQQKDDKQAPQKIKKQKPQILKPKYHLIQAKKSKQQTSIKNYKQAELKLIKIFKQFSKLSNQKRIQYLDTMNLISTYYQYYYDYQQLTLLLADIPIRMHFAREQTKQLGQPFCSRDHWNRIFQHVVLAFNILKNSQDVQLINKIVTFSSQNQQNAEKKSQKDVYDQIKGSINDLQKILKKCFQHLQTNESEYSIRIQDLLKFIQFLYQVSKAMSTQQNLQKQASQITFKVFQNMYFMSSEFLQKIKLQAPQLSFSQLSDQGCLQQFIAPIFRSQDQSSSSKALLYLIYNHAINRRDKAKDLFAMTNLSQTIISRDFQTQVTYNRALVQLGISSFHQGNLYQAQQILSSICSTGKSRQQNKQNIKRLLGQAKLQDQTTTRHKILPRYLHLNIDLIQAIELIASMILEIPFTLTEGGKFTSRSFKKVATQHERSHFISEPVNYRNLIYAAGCELKVGNMKQCLQKLKQIQIWDEIGNSDQALTNLQTNVKQTALRCYILANRDCFSSISLQRLAKKFETDLKTVNKLICKQICQRKISGSIYEGYLILTQKRKQKQSGLRSINNTLFTKLQILSKNNQLIFKQRQQPVPDEQQQGQKQQEAVKRLHDVIADKLKHILSRRGV